MHPGSPGSYWDQIADNQRAGGGRLWRSYTDQAYSNWLKAWLGHEGQLTRALKTDLFDEVVHTGLVPELQRLASEVHGIDVSGSIARVAAERHPQLLTRTGDVRQLPYPNDYFDLVLSNSTLDHFPKVADIEQSLAEIHRVLRPGGRLLITLDNPANPIVGLRTRLPLSWTTRLGLIHFYLGATLSQTGLRRCLERADLAVIREGYFMHVPRLPAILLGRVLEKVNWAGLHRLWVQVLLACETLECWPARKYTGYYVAALAHKTAGR